MKQLSEIPNDKVIVLRFRGGGPRDGDSRSDAKLGGDDRVSGEHVMYWLRSNGGQIGKRISAYSKGPLNDYVLDRRTDLVRHWYEIVDRIETETEIILVCEHRGAELETSEDEQ